MSILPTTFGEWLSLVEHLVRDQGVGGSNPLSPTILKIIKLQRKSVSVSRAEAASMWGFCGYVQILRVQVRTRCACGEKGRLGKGRSCYILSVHKSRCI